MAIVDVVEFVCGYLGLCFLYWFAHKCWVVPQPKRDSLWSVGSGVVPPYEAIAAYGLDVAKTEPRQRRAMRESFEFRAEIVRRNKMGQVHVLDECFIPYGPFGCGLVKASVYWRYRRIYGKSPR
jgi:hypothetical protein